MDVVRQEKKNVSNYLNDVHTHMHAQMFSDSVRVSCRHIFSKKSYPVDLDTAINLHSSCSFSI